MAKDKKGKGSGSKDACYHKVKSRYSVWPSAYASGALVKCRKVGAANWGNKSESFEINPEKHKEAQRTAEREDKLRKRAKSGDQGSEIAAKKTKGPKMMGEGKYSKSETYVKGTAPVRATYGGKTESFPKETYKKKSKKVEVSEGDKYDNVGKQAARMSLLNNPGPRSTPEQTAEKKARLEKKRGMKLDDHPQFKKEEVEEGYRVVSTSFKSGDGDPKDDVTIKKQKKVVSGDNLTKKGAERSANARRQEYGAGDAFQVQKTKTAKKRSSNAASEADVKAKIDAKEKKQQKSRAQQSIAGMNRAGTPSGKVAAARLKTDKKFNQEEVDKRRAPSELVARLSAKREGHMAQDGPNKAAYDAKQRILKKTKDKMTEEIVRSILDEAGKKCWKGYKKAGTQKLFGKTYNRCVKANEELSIDQQMKISRDYNRMSPEEKKAANKKAMGNVKKVAPKKDTRTDAQKMTDATGPRPGSRYRGD